MSDKLDSPPIKEKAKVSGLSLSSEQTLTFAGPLPPPQILQKYGEIGASYPERIFVMAEKEQEMTHALQKEAISLERQLMEQQAQSFKRGQRFSVFLATIAILATIILGLNGHDYLAAAVFGVVLLGIIKEIMSSIRHKP